MFDPAFLNPWHAVPTNPGSPEVVTGLVEIPNGKRAKYEVDKVSGLLKLDRVLLPSMGYPANYGFIPRTYAGDGDPLDILVLSQISLVPLCLVDARVIGVLRMIDSGEPDDKIIAVAENDASVNQIQDINDLPKYRQEEIAHFFEEYKKLEGKHVILEGFHGREEALKIVQESVDAYQQLELKS